jgi:outer membrane protein assembly factor BamB
MSTELAKNNLKNKSKQIIASVLIITIAASIMLSVVNAEDVQTYAYISVAPNPIGVGQSAHVSVWLNNFPLQLPGQPYEDMGYHGFSVTITKPDGTTQTWGPEKSDPIGAQWFDFTPDTVGTYYFQFSFPGETMGTRTYLPSTSLKFELTVQDEQIQPWPAAPLPTEYWQRPIDAQNREWSSISGNVLGGEDTRLGIFNPYSTAPNTAHIIWTRELDFGGLIGGEFGSANYYTGLSYETKWSSPIIINGVLYYNHRFSSSGGLSAVAVDLRTGETLWKKDNTVNFGQVLDFDAQNQHGGIAYLWQTGSTWNMYDAYTGDLVISIPNATGGYLRYRYDEKGNILVYILNGGNNWLAMWNSTLCIESATGGAGFGGNDPDYWRPQPQKTYNWPDGIQWNVTVPDVAGSQSLQAMDNEVIYARSTLQTMPTSIVCDVGYSAETGQQLWVQNRTEQPSRVTGGMHEGVFIEYIKETMVWYGYDAKTGKQLWGPTEPRESGWGLYYTGGTSLGGPGAGAFYAYGKFYSTTYDGMIYCYDIKTGEELWTYFSGTSGLETPYGHWPFGGGQMAIADGKLFVVNSEHSPNTPLYRGYGMHVVDVDTGEAVWRIEGWYQVPIVADGYMVVYNGYDNRLYCFGKGPSATTVMAGPKSATMDDKVIIEGVVTDEAVGTKQGEPSVRFPHGVPAISDESMSSWMEYVYMQQPLPTDATGVEVTIDVIDSNGNYRNIGTATADISGFYSFEWQPDIPGKYTVIATFTGSETYYASYSETAFTVVEPTITPAPTPTPAPMTDMYVTGFGSGIIIVLVIGFALLLLRKR